jgi:hypothetical protein
VQRADREARERGAQLMGEAARIAGRHAGVLVELQHRGLHAGRPPGRGVRAQRLVHALGRAAGREQQPRARPRGQAVEDELGGEQADPLGVAEDQRSRRTGRHGPMLPGPARAWA